jgi:hypothetical protein
MHRDRHTGVLGQVADVLAHLGGACRAVEADHVDGRIASMALSAAAISVPGSMRPVSSMVTCTWMGTSTAHLGHGCAAAVHRGLHTQQIELGLDDEQVDATLDQSDGLLLVEVAELRVPDLAERRELGARPDRSGHEPPPIGRAHVVGDFACQPSRREVEFVHPLGHAVLGERHPERPEGVGLDHVRTGGVVVGMHLTDELGPGDAEQLVASFQRLAPEVVGRQAALLQVGAGGAVVDDDALSEQVEKRRHGDLLTGDETGLVAIASRGLSPYPSGRLTSSRQATTGSAAPVR